jgi:hypothetical protein
MFKIRNSAKASGDPTALSGSGQLSCSVSSFSETVEEIRYMSTPDKNQKTELTIPPFLKRWSIFLRRYPHFLLNFGFLFGVVSGRNPILWDNVMYYEKRHALCKGRVHSEDCRKREVGKERQSGAWHDES